ncbi:MAG: hypothetical protein HXS46_16485 [Theionarchaea archaeon]|nr:hypothetical protein [Theionarchaea archaeon]
MEVLACAQNTVLFDEQRRNIAYYLKVQTESFPGAQNFDVETGMRSDGPIEILDFIRKRMQLCFIFLGILIEKYTLDRIDDEGKKCAPGAWVLIDPKNNKFTGIITAVKYSFDGFPIS